VIVPPLFGEDRTMALPAFFQRKAAATDVERLVCVVFYAKYYRELSRLTIHEIEEMNAMLSGALRIGKDRLKVAIRQAKQRGLIKPTTPSAIRFVITRSGETFVQALSPFRASTRPSSVITSRSNWRGPSRTLGMCDSSDAGSEPSSFHTSVEVISSFNREWAPDSGYLPRSAVHISGPGLAPKTNKAVPTEFANIFHVRVTKVGARRHE
jgi:hypothetical protein